MSSPPDHDRRLMDLVSMVLRRPAIERDDYLRRACRGDPDLYVEASDVVRSQEKMGDFLLEPVLVLQKPARPFSPGQVVADRFEITREIGEGGMGVVYEAFDRKRNLRIAIKSAKPGFQRLLSPELEGAIQVSHRNICRVNEIHTAHTEHGEVDFLTMELLDGETLSAYLQRRGKLSRADALEIARQLCEGLAEAHRSGVIHRDLKSSNIILCRNANGALRVVTTDFGLAGIGNQPGELVGTPLYMAPELWLGKPASKASDIYALGVILYQMVAHPDVEELGSVNGTFETHKSLSESVAKGLPQRWARAISHCLKQSPEARPTDALEVLGYLERPSLTLVMIAVPLLAGASLLSPRVREGVHDRIWPPPSVRLVVLPVSTQNSPSARPPAEFSGGVMQDVADRISHFRSGSRSVAVISPTEAQNLQVRTPEQAKSALHATHALLTTMVRDEQDLVVRGSVVDLSTLTPIRDFTGRYSPSTSGALPGALAAEVSTGLRLQGVPPESVSAAATASYDRGLYLLSLNSESVDEGIKNFQAASRMDPGSALPLAGLVEAEIKRFEDTKDATHLNSAQQYLRAAENLNPDSVRVHLAAGKVDEATSQYERALENYLRVSELEPHNVAGFVRVAGAYDKLGMPEKAIESYQKAIKLDPTYYEAYKDFGIFYYSHGNYSEAAKQFQFAVDRAPGNYDAYAYLAAALDDLGRDAEAKQALLASLKLRETSRALNSLGVILQSEGKDAEAVEYFRRAIAINPLVNTYFLNLADSNRRLGHLRSAAAEYREALRLVLEQLDKNPRDGYARSLVAYFAARLGDRPRAQEEMPQALQLSPSDTRVIKRAVLTYVALNSPDDAIAVLGSAPPELLRDLDTHPDLAVFRQDLRFRKLVAEISLGGK
jgi:serine/threonine protein kinase/tetratricopeptide (TPR) repeat protein